MKSTGKLLGIVLVVGGLVILAAVIGWLVMAEGLSKGGAMLGLILSLVLAFPLIGAGIYIWFSGKREETSMARVAQQRKLLNIIQTQGQISIGDIVLEMGSTYDQVKNMIYDLVGKGLFSGYINWDDGKLYSQQASQLRDATTCKHCGGQVNLAGKGVVRCPYCGTEYFLS